MKRDNKLMKFTSFVLLVVMIALILVAGTFAKYTSSASGESTAIVAKWEILAGSETNMLNISGSNQTIDFNLFDTIKEEDGTTDELDVLADENGNVIRIAPGTSGAFDLHIENNSEVTAVYAINFGIEGEASDIPLLFKVGDNDWKEGMLDEIGNAVLPMDDASTTDVDEGKAVVNVQWKWSFEKTTTLEDGSTVVDTDNDANDTAFGIEPGDIIVSAELIVEQYDASEPKMDLEAAKNATLQVGWAFVTGKTSDAVCAGTSKNIYLTAGTTITVSNVDEYSVRVYNQSSETIGETQAYNNVAYQNDEDGTLTIGQDGWYAIGIENLVGEFNASTLRSLGNYVTFGTN